MAIIIIIILYSDNMKNIKIKKENTDVLIVGAGPCGALLANLLGHYGVKTLIIDRSEDIIDYPRAVGIDDESLRSLQIVDLVDEVLKDSIQDVPLRLFTRNRKVFAHIEPKTKVFGWSRRNIFMQPELEKNLRKKFSEYSNVSFKAGTTLKSFSEENGEVRALTECSDGNLTTISAKYLIGTDGGRSTVRKLSKIGFEGQTHERKWLVIDVRNDPLEEFYTGLHGDPRRPWLSVWLPKGYRRWEFMMFDGEDDNDLLDDAKIESLMREKLPGNVPLDIARARIYTHHSRTASTFRKSRIFLAGDAAHLTEPWIGQGLNSGLRDVTNLAWKLGLVINQGVSDRLLDSYTKERREHAQDMTALARQFGAIFAMTNPVKAFFRDLFFMSIKRIPPVRRYVTEFKFKPMPRYSEGYVLHDDIGAKNSPVGRMIIQPLVSTKPGVQVKFDACMGQGFAIVGVGLDPLEYLSEVQQKNWKKMGCTFVSLSRKGRPIPQTTKNVLALEDFEGEFFKLIESGACKAIFVLRPDKYVAAHADAQEIDATVSRLFDALND